ncbi:MAG: response regulator [Kiritimatiellae bacterium]|nr:response regulator [Kiritimatiellia bacterium]
MTTLLMIDDEELFLKSMSRYFERKGYRVVAERLAEKALACFQAEPEAFDAVILDHDMPDLSGAECLRRILALRPETPVIVMSGYPPETLPPGDYARARALLGKPMDLADVERAVQACLKR